MGWRNTNTCLGRPAPRNLAALLLSRTTAEPPTQAPVGRPEVHQAIAQPSSQTPGFGRTGRKPPTPSLLLPPPKALVTPQLPRHQKRKHPYRFACKRVKRRHFPSSTGKGRGGAQHRGPPGRAEVFDSVEQLLWPQPTRHPSLVMEMGKRDVSRACPSWVWQRPKHVKSRGKAT